MAQSRVFRGTARLITRKDGVASFWYHNTAVVTLHAHKLVLDSGGWRTNTTKLAMNQVANEYALGFQVYQRKGEWFVQYLGVEFVFEDGMTIMRGEPHV